MAWLSWLESLPSFNEGALQKDVDWLLSFESLLFIGVSKGDECQILCALMLAGLVRGAELVLEELELFASEGVGNT